jgi:hypothetical protein
MIVAWLCWTTSSEWLDAEHVYATARTAPRTKFCSIKVYLTQRHTPELLYFKSVPLHITASDVFIASQQHNLSTEIH